MAIGLGVVLIVVGAVLIWALDEAVNIDFIEENTLGVILLIAGLLAIGLSLAINAQRSRHQTTHVEERRTDGTL
jgi:drug/metabolite transporter (DMT)-like permease